MRSERIFWVKGERKTGDLLKKGPVNRKESQKKNVEKDGKVPSAKNVRLYEGQKKESA